MDYDSPQARVLRAVSRGATLVTEIAKAAELPEQDTRTCLMRLRAKGFVKKRRVVRVVETVRTIYEPVGASCILADVWEK